jgi:hypothetical protein
MRAGRRGAAALALLAALAGCHPKASRPGGADSGWVGTWGTAPQLTEPANLPPEPGLAGNTLRQVVRVSLGGDRLRVHFSNAFGTSPVTLRAAHLAVSLGAGAIDPATDRALSFGGRPEVTIPAGATATSDPLSFPLRPLSDVAVSVRFGETSPAVTGHPGSRTTSYIAPGDAVSATQLPGASRTDHWYVLTGIDVAEHAFAVVTLGNSITDDAARAPTGRTAGRTSWRAASRPTRARAASRCSTWASAGTASCATAWAPPPSTASSATCCGAAACAGSSSSKG